MFFIHLQQRACKSKTNNFFCYFTFSNGVTTQVKTHAVNAIFANVSKLCVFQKGNILKKKNPKVLLKFKHTLLN